MWKASPAEEQRGLVLMSFSQLFWRLTRSLSTARLMATRQGSQAISSGALLSVAAHMQLRETSRTPMALPSNSLWEAWPELFPSRLPAASRHSQPSQVWRSSAQVRCLPLGENSRLLLVQTSSVQNPSTRPPSTAIPKTGSIDRSIARSARSFSLSSFPCIISGREDPPVFPNVCHIRSQRTSKFTHTPRMHPTTDRHTTRCGRKLPGHSPQCSVER